MSPRHGFVAAPGAVRRISLPRVVTLANTGVTHRWILRELHDCDEMEIDIAAPALDAARAHLVALIEDECRALRKKVRFVGQGTV